MTIIQSLKTYFDTFSELESNRPLLTNFLGALPTQYAIVPLGGTRTIETYLDDSRLCEYPFAFQTMEYTVEEAERLESQGFMEELAEWLDDQSDADTLPSLGAGKTAHSIEALGHGYLFQEGESGAGIYQIQCRLTYKQD